MTPARLLAPLLLLPLLSAAPLAQEGAAPDAAGDDEGFAYVQMVTSFGEMVLEIDRQAAPATAENFLAYVDDGFYDGTIFHRVIAGFMAQGGGFEPGLVRKPPTREPVRNESRGGRSNKGGTLAMARTSDPHSASSQFFINLTDNPQLDDRGGDQWGYTVFGEVIAGFETLAAIASVPVELNREVDARSAAYPVEPIVIESAKQVPASACAGAIAAARAREHSPLSAPDVQARVRELATEHDDPVHALLAALGHDPAQLRAWDSGLSTLAVEQGDGAQAGPESTVEVHYTGYLLDGTIFDSSRQRGQPATFPLQGVIRAWTEGVSQMRVGDRWLLVAPPDMAYGASGAGNGVIPPNATLVFDIELLDVKDYHVMERGKQLLADKGIDVSAGTTTESGLFYVDTEMGSGAQPTRSDRVRVHYSGWLNDGTQFDSSIDRGEPAEFGVTQVIPGWTEALLGMQAGGTRWVVIPWQLAYGAAGRPPMIPPRASLVFEIRLLGIAP